MEGTFYPANDYRDYLAHFGVKGMKWGVRKSLRSFGQKAKGTAAKGYKMAMRRAARNTILQSQRSRQNNARIQELAQAKNLGDIVSMTVGNKRNARVQRVNAKMYDELAKYSNFEHTRKKYKAAADNSRTFEKYYDRLRKKRGKDKVIEMLTNKEAYSLPWKRANGKTISYGRHVVEDTVNKLLLAAAKDYARYSLNKELEKRRSYNQVRDGHR